VAYFCPHLVAMATSFAPLKIQVAYLNSQTPEPTPYTQKVARYLHRTEISAILAYLLPKFGCHGNALCSLENSNNISEFANHKNTPYMQNVSRYLYRTEISAIVAYFCPNLVVTATPFAPLKIQITCLNSPTPKTTP